EQLALPGSIRLTTATLRLVEGLVQVKELGLVPVKGMAEPVEVFELVGASTIRRRLQATVTRGLTRFVGRDMELEALHQALERAGSGVRFMAERPAFEMIRHVSRDSPTAYAGWRVRCYPQRAYAAKSSPRHVSRLLPLSHVHDHGSQQHRMPGERQ